MPDHADPAESLSGNTDVQQKQQKPRHNFSPYKIEVDQKMLLCN